MRLQGGGSFFSFPALLATGIAPIAANVTNTIALWPGSIASIAAYRRPLWVERKKLPWLIFVSLMGGWIGAFLLLHLEDVTFNRMVPYLLLVATLLFSFGPRMVHLVRHSMQSVPSWPWVNGVLLTFLQFSIAIYGGFFGGGIGILMLALLGFMGYDNIHTMNGMKCLLSAVINGVAVITFCLSGKVVWMAAVIMIIGAIVGGYGGAHLAQKIPAHWIRKTVIFTGFLTTIIFFFKSYTA